MHLRPRHGSRAFEEDLIEYFSLVLSLSSSLDVQIDGSFPMNNAEERKSVSLRESRARDIYGGWSGRDEEKETAREGPHLPRMAAETGRVATDDPVAPGIKFTAAWNDESLLDRE